MEMKQQEVGDVCSVTLNTDVFSGFGAEELVRSVPLSLGHASLPLCTSLTSCWRPDFHVELRVYGNEGQWKWQEGPGSVGAKVTTVASILYSQEC